MLDPKGASIPKWIKEVYEGARKGRGGRDFFYIILEGGQKPTS